MLFQHSLEWIFLRKDLLVQDITAKKVDRYEELVVTQPGFFPGLDSSGLLLCRGGYIKKDW